MQRVITRHLLYRTGLKADEADSGAVTLIQRFGSAANLNIHLHCLVLEGVYRRTDGEPVFVEAPAPTDEELQALLNKIITRLMKVLTRRGVLVEEEEGGSRYLADADTEADSDEARALRPLQAAAWPCRPRLASGQALRQAQTVHRTVCVRAQLTALPSARAPGKRCGRCKAQCHATLRLSRICVPTSRATEQHAAVRCDADERQRLEQLCRTITRPALANERVQINSAGQVVLKLKTPWRDGTTHIVMSPLEFMQRLAALVPRPRLHLIRFHGVLAPNAKLRALVVPHSPAQANGRSELPATEPGCAHGRPVRIS